MTDICGCGHLVSAHATDGKCTEWWRYPDVLDARQCGCIAVRPPKQERPERSMHELRQARQKHATELSTEEAAVVQRFEAGADAEESLRERLGRWLFERDYRERGLASPDDATWHEFVDRNQEEWREEGDALLAFLRSAA